MANKNQILTLYKTLIRESQKFSSYNFREYAVRKVRDSFRENRQLADPKLVEEKLKFASKSLEIVKRQVNLSHMYGTGKLVIENATKK